MFNQLKMINQVRKAQKELAREVVEVEAGGGAVSDGGHRHQRGAGRDLRQVVHRLHYAVAGATPAHPRSRSGQPGVCDPGEFGGSGEDLAAPPPAARVRSFRGRQVGWPQVAPGRLAAATGKRRVLRARCKAPLTRAAAAARDMTRRAHSL